MFLMNQKQIIPVSDSWTNDSLGQFHLLNQKHLTQLV